MCVCVWLCRACPHVLYSDLPSFLPSFVSFVPFPTASGIREGKEEKINNARLPRRGVDASVVVAVVVVVVVGVECDMSVDEWLLLFHRWMAGVFWNCAQILILNFFSSLPPVFFPRG